MSDNQFSFEDELDMEETKMINLTRNEILFIDDSCTMLIEPEVNLPLPYKPLNRSGSIAVPVSFIEKIGFGLLVTETEANIDIEFDLGELLMIREACLTTSKYGKEDVGINIKTKIYKALLGKEWEERERFQRLMFNSNVDLSTIE
tara:strand:- start:5158 stop:5595 length:438 start_codon:yes stop_codon:yes gene_type:complete